MKVMTFDTVEEMQAAIKENNIRVQGSNEHFIKMYREANAGNSRMVILERGVEGLIQMAEDQDPKDENASAFLGENKAMARNCGMGIYILFGDGGLHFAMARVKTHPHAKHFARELEYAFDGIGSWSA